MSSEATLECLTSNVYILNSPFVQSKRGLIVDKFGSILIDTSVSLAETKLMLRHAEKQGSAVSRIIITHGHFDHTVGCQLLPDGERIAQQGAGEWMLSDHAKSYLALEPPEHPDLRNFQITLPTLEIDGSAVLRLSDRTLYLFPTPGHSPDSMSVLLEPDGILFTGDAVITCFPPVIQDGNSAQAVTSLRKILTVEYKWLVPGHGSILNRSNAQRHCQMHLDYLEEILSRISKIDDPNTPLTEIQSQMEDLTSIFPATIEMVEVWQPKAVAKIWKERSQSLNYITKIGLSAGIASRS